MSVYKMSLSDLPDTMMRLMGIDHDGKAVWVKCCGHIHGVTVTENPKEAQLFTNHADMRTVFKEVQRTQRLRGVAVQFVKKDNLQPIAPTAPDWVAR